MATKAPNTPQSVASPSDPFCSNCGYNLQGCTDSSKCPECGRPLVEVLTRGKSQPAYQGKRYRSPITLFGLPLIDIALGPSGDQLRGKARGIIAIGDIAVGWVALGGVACGGIAAGGLAIGAIALGGCSVGILAAIGGLAIALGLANGGVALGAIASAGAAIGIVAVGGAVIGIWARGGGGFGPHFNDAQASQVIKNLSLFLGDWPPHGPLAGMQGMVAIIALTLLLAILMAAIVACGLWRKGKLAEVLS